MEPLCRRSLGPAVWSAVAVLLVACAEPPASAGIEAADPGPSPDAAQLDASVDVGADALPSPDDAATSVDADVPEQDVPPAEDTAAAPDVPKDDVPPNDASTDVPAGDVPTEDVPTEDVPAEDVPTEDVLLEDVSADVPEEDVSPEDASTDDVTTEDVPLHEVTPEDVIAEDVTADDVATEDVHSDEDVTPGDEDATPGDDTTDPQDITEDTGGPEDVGPTAFCTADAECDDGDACNGAERCVDGAACARGPAPACDDQNPCTADTCLAASGCKYTPLLTACDDGDPCTAGDTCAAGHCAGVARTCDDGDGCTHDSCGPGGCTHAPVEELPALNLVAPEDGAVVKGPVALAVVVTGPARGAPRLLDSGLGLPLDAVLVDAGPHELAATVTACNGTVVTSSRRFVVDPLPPSCRATLSPPPNAAGWSNTPTTVTFEAEDDGAGLETVSEPVVVTAPGETVVTGTAVDRAGHETTASATVRMDVHAPLVVLSGPKPNQPANDQWVSQDSSVTLTGTIGDEAPGVSAAGFSRAVAFSSRDTTRVDLAPGPFTVTFALREGVNTLTVAAMDHAGNAGLASLMVVRDAEPPRVAIQTPTGPVSGPTVDVAGLAHDLVVGSITAEDVTVTVNGVSATVLDGRFFAAGVPVSAGETTLTAVATDAVGLTATAAVTVPVVPSALELVSGGGQTGAPKLPLDAPVVFRVTTPPLEGREVTVAITDNDGALAAGPAGTLVALGPEGRRALLRTDAQGLCSVTWTLGSRAGAGVNRLSATAGSLGSQVALASANAGPPANLYATSGDNAVGTPGEPLPMPLSVLATDTHGNGVAGAVVRFEVSRGDGRFADGVVATALTNDKGVAHAVFVPGDALGSGAQAVRATVLGFDSSTALGAEFSVSTLARNPGETTRVSGLILDEDQAPVAGVTLSTEDGSQKTQSDGDGRFLLPTPPGFVRLTVDGRTAQRPAVDERFPVMTLDLNLVEGALNPIERPIYLLRLAAGQRVDAVRAGPIRLTLPELPGYELTIPTGTVVTFPDGSHEGYVSLTQVNNDQAPMPPVNGLAPRVLVTIQPAGTRFEPPAPLTLPNTEGHSRGRKVELVSFDHDLEAFVPVGTGTVSEDGSLIRSDPGVGVLKGGWHGGSTPGGQGNAATITAKLTNNGQKLTSVSLEGTGQPGADTSWQFCASGSITVGNAACPNKTSCPTSAKAASGLSGFGVVKVVHKDTRGNQAQDYQLVTVCPLPPVTLKTAHKINGDFFTKFVERAGKVTQRLGCKPAATYKFNTAADATVGCCGSCPGITAKNFNLSLDAEASMSLKCSVPGASIPPIEIPGVATVEVGLSVTAKLVGAAGVSVAVDNCRQPADIQPKGNANVKLAIQVDATLASVKLGKKQVANVTGSAESSVTGTLELQRKEFQAKVCWDGVTLKGKVVFLDFTLVDYKKVLFCPQTVWETVIPFTPPAGLVGGTGCPNGALPPLVDPPCGKPITFPDPNAPLPPVNTGSTKNACGAGCDSSATGGCTSDAECDNGNVCDGLETCSVAKACEKGTPLVCEPDQHACTTVACDPIDGCVQQADDTACNDSLDCTTDRCDLVVGCTREEDDSRCNDGVACTIDRCNKARPAPGTGCEVEFDDQECTDGVSCTDDFCDPFDGCRSTPNLQKCADDGVPCTETRCDLVRDCQDEPRDTFCDDGFACTVDRCDPTEGCVFQPQDSACNDALECTTDVCVPGEGCIYTADDTLCDDGVDCTLTQCNPLTGCDTELDPTRCADGLECTEERCDPVKGCVLTPNDAACDDGEPCTNDACEPTAGCTHTPDDGLCDDGDPNTVDRCAPPCVSEGEPGGGGTVGCAGCPAGSTDCCCSDDDCPGDGIARCEAGQVVRHTCEGGSCVKTVPGCEAFESAGPPSCASLTQPVAFTCSGAVCTVAPLPACPPGTSCKSGQCGGTP